MADIQSKPESLHVERTMIEDSSDTEQRFDEDTTWHMIIFASWIGLLGWLANFDAAFGGIVLLMGPYQKSFGNCRVDAEAGGAEVCSLTALQQSLIQLTLLFMALGGGLTGVVGGYIGRRTMLQLGCFSIAVGAAGMMASSGSFTNYMVCKCIGGLGIGVLYAVAPVWGTESVTPHKRGMLMSLYNVGLACGNVVAAAVCVGSSKIPTDWSWRTPILCQIPVAILLIAGSMFFHESPRWLISKGRLQEARASFARFYDLDPNSPQVDWQVDQVVQHIQFEQSVASEASAMQLFRGVDFRRTHVAVLSLLGNSLTGVQFVIPYAALFLSQMGIQNPYALNVAISSCVLAGTLPGPFLCEYLGRRFSLLGGYVVMGVSMLILAVVASVLGQSGHATQIVMVLILCIWAFTFGATTGPISFVSSSEMHSLSLRTMGQAYATTIYQICAFGAAFWTPYMLNEDYGNMGTNVGYFYFGVTAVIFVLTFLFLPETGRLSLEQIDEFFYTGGAAWKTSLKANKRTATTLPKSA